MEPHCIQRGEKVYRCDWATKPLKRADKLRLTAAIQPLEAHFKS